MTVDELLLMVNVALNLRPVSVCSPGDTSGDGEITVDEILAGVEAVLRGCG